MLLLFDGICQTLAYLPLYIALLTINNFRLELLRVIDTLRAQHRLDIERIIFGLLHAEVRLQHANNKAVARQGQQEDREDEE